MVDGSAQRRVEKDLREDSSLNTHLVSGQHILIPAELIADDFQNEPDCCSVHQQQTFVVCHPSLVGLGKHLGLG